MHGRALLLPACEGGAAGSFARGLTVPAAAAGTQQRRCCSSRVLQHQQHQEHVAICSPWPTAPPSRRLVAAHGRRKASASLPPPEELAPAQEEATPVEPPKGGKKGRKRKTVETPQPSFAQDYAAGDSALAVPPVGSPAELTQTSAASVALQQPEAVEGYEGVKAGLADDSREKTVLREQIGHDIYVLPRNLSEEAVLDESELPRKYHSVTVSPREAARTRFGLALSYWEDRVEHQQYVHDLAFQAHHYTRERAANIYANSRRIAGLMSAFEEDDFRLQNLAPSNIAPWARSEIVFYTEHQEYNQYITEHADKMVKKLPREAQEEELDLLDEALFLMRTDDDNAAAQRAGQQSAEQELLDQYLEGTLPGATLDNLAASYAKDIFDGQDEYADDGGLGAATDDGDGVAAGVDGAEAEAEVGQA